MKIIYTILFSLTVLTNYSQAIRSQLYKEGLIRNIKSYSGHYLSHIEFPWDDELKEHILNSKDDFIYSGLAFYNNNMEVEWIYVPRNGEVQDFWENENYIYLLSQEYNSTKGSSNPKLYYSILNKSGHLLKEKLIDEKRFIGSGKMSVYFSPNGNIWKLVEQPTYNGSYNAYHETGLASKCYLLEVYDYKLNKLSTEQFSANSIYLEDIAFNDHETSMVFSTNTENTHNVPDTIYQYPASENAEILVQFTQDGKFTRKKYIATGHSWIESITYQGDELILQGDFENEPNFTSTFMEMKLKAPKSQHGNSSARNTYIASLDTSLNLKWMKTITGTNNVLSNSISADEETIAFSFKFRDKVKVGDQTIIGNNSSQYQDSDPVICYFDSNGKLTSYERMSSYSSDWNDVYLFPERIIMHGSFLYDLEVMGEKLVSESKYEVHYLSVFKR